MADSPEFQDQPIRDISQETKKRIESEYQDVISPDVIEQDSFYQPAYSQTSQFMSQNRQKPIESFYQPEALSQAIKKRAMQPYETQMDAQKYENKLETMNRHFGRLQTVSQMVAAEDDLNKRIIMAKYKQEQARKAARGAFIGQVLGLGGAVAGFMYGGPMGAAAGYQIGSSVGQSAGSK